MWTAITLLIVETRLLDERHITLLNAIVKETRCFFQGHCRIMQCEMKLVRFLTSPYLTQRNFKRIRRGEDQELREETQGSDPFENHVERHLCIATLLTLNLPPGKPDHPSYLILVNTMQMGSSGEGNRNKE
jgi:hypothetical protein